MKDAAMNSEEFLKQHSLNPDLINPDIISDLMVESIKAGLAGTPKDLLMLPTYLRFTGSVPKKTAIVIDAGGTNFRCGLATFEDNGCTVSDVTKCPMPGTQGPVTWDQFIAFVAEKILPLTVKSDLIGFCFSFSAKVTPEIDALVETMDKEVIITGCEGKPIAGSLLAELESKGIKGKRCIILNDTVAALLGGAASLKREKYSDFIGLICGTGVNTCSIHDGMLYNQEAGLFSQIPSGDFDIMIDKASAQPGEKLLEKKCSGAYVGEIAKLALNLEGEVNGATVSKLCDCGNDFEKAVCKAIIKRSARCVAANIIAVMKYNDTGKDKPMCVCAEGSLISKNPYYLPYLEETLKQYAPDRKVEIHIGHDTTLPGSGAAVLLNT